MPACAACSCFSLPLPLSNIGIARSSGLLCRARIVHGEMHLPQSCFAALFINKVRRRACPPSSQEWKLLPLTVRNLTTGTTRAFDTSGGSTCGKVDRGHDSSLNCLTVIFSFSFSFFLLFFFSFSQYASHPSSSLRDASPRASKRDASLADSIWPMLKCARARSREREREREGERENAKRGKTPRKGDKERGHVWDASFA